MCLRNARDIGVLNGLRGTVVDVEEGSRSLRVALDGQAEEVVLPTSYLEEGHVAHGYAMTVHKSQGMSTARTYVLGTPELYAELGYTALSRHQQSCRFYLNAGETPAEQLELDAAGEQRDQTLTRIERALGRSRAQEMALDVHERDADLTRMPDIQLAERAGRLDELLNSYPKAARDADRHADELQRRAEEIRGHEARLAASRAAREAMGVLRRSERARLDERIARHDAVLARARVDYGELADEAGAGCEAGERWAEAHGVELAEATVAERELVQRRRAVLEDAVARAAHDSNSELAGELGPRPKSLLERERWDSAAAGLVDYHQRYGALPELQLPPDAPRRRTWLHNRGAADELRAARDEPKLAPGRGVDVDGPDLGP